VDLVVDEVEQLEDVHVADGDLLLERLARLAVEEPQLAGRLAPRGAPLVDDERDRRVGVLLDPADESLVHVLLGRAVENRARNGGRNRLGPVLRGCIAVLGEDAVGGCPAEVRLEDLPDVHAARDAERVEHDVDRPAVLEERHVLLGHDLRDHTLVPVTAGELVALRDLALLGDVHPHELVHAR
jgi:hypothetical protein